MMNLGFDKSLYGKVKSLDGIIRGGSQRQFIGHRMIKSVKIDNFGCFESIKLSDCRRINVIVGRNASGKTALLEALFLASGASPQLYMRTTAWRGEPMISSTNYEAVWKDLFHKFDQSKTISIKFVGSTGFGRSLRILYDTVPPVFSLAVRDSTSSAQGIVIPIVFNYTDEKGKNYKVSPIVKDGALTAGAVKLPPIRSTFFPTHSSLPAQQYAAFFSDLSKHKKQVPVVDLLRTEFPFVENVSVEVGISGLPTLYASITHLPEKIPVAFLSSGINKLLCILLAIAAQPAGIILIDEIENGFYFDRLSPIWSLILKFAVEYDVQVFASTHSKECLQALIVAMKDHEDNFSLIRMSTEEAYKTEVEQFDGQTFLAALRQHGEIR
jgi:hypothetical protein